MYLGKIVEIAERDEIFERPTHPYTHALLSAVPVPVPRPWLHPEREQIVITGDIPSPATLPSLRSPSSQPLPYSPARVRVARRDHTEGVRCHTMLLLSMVRATSTSGSDATEFANE